jgi:hypothetical protein
MSIKLELVMHMKKKMQHLASVDIKYSYLENKHGPWWVTTLVPRLSSLQESTFKNA